MFVRYQYSFHVSHQYTLHVIIIGGETTHRRCLVLELQGGHFGMNGKMVFSCYTCGCTNRQGMAGITFFRFPKDQERRAKYM